MSYDLQAAIHAVSVRRPCAVCGKDHKCSFTNDGLFLCGREKGPVPGFRCLGPAPKDPTWTLFRSETDDPPRLPPKAAPGPAIDFTALALRLSGNLDDRRRADLAAHLRLTVEVLSRIPYLGFVPLDEPDGGCWTFPEYDGGGNVIGLNRRWSDGRKKALKGSARGLTLVSGWSANPGPIFAVEGASDVLAVTAAGLAAVGRPSNRAGVDLLAELLRDFDDRSVIIVGENDCKKSGEWPGQEGAVTTAAKLAEKLGREVRYAIVPGGAKDAREWLLRITATQGWAEAGAELSRLLVSAALPPNQPTKGEPRPEDQPAVLEGDDDPHRLARLFLQQHETAEGLGLRYWCEDFYQWNGTGYRAVPEADLQSLVTKTIKEEFDRLNREALSRYVPGADERKGPPKVRAVNRQLVGNVVQALQSLCLVSGHSKAPCWLGEPGPDPAHVLACKNGLLHLTGWVNGRDDLIPHSPLYFSFNFLDYDYDRSAPPPVAWLKFLDDLWGTEPDNIRALQEWFGYVLANDTSRQKILLLFGPRRSGKSTISRVLRALVGEDNVCAPTLSSLSTQFGLAPLVGKTLAAISDARLSRRADAALVTERLLSISGEDALTVDRKYREPITLRLPARIAIISNDLLSVDDASGALASRLLVLATTRVFAGAEDHGLTARLYPELPSILIWALEGWKRLSQQGRFTEPERGKLLLESIEDLGSPVKRFVEDACVVGDDRVVETRMLYALWRQWCRVQNMAEKDVLSDSEFGKALHSACTGVSSGRARNGNGRRMRVYRGIAPDPDWRPPR